MAYGSLDFGRSGFLPERLIAGDRRVEGFWLGPWMERKSLPAKIALLRELRGFHQQGVFAISRSPPFTHWRTCRRPSWRRSGPAARSSSISAEVPARPPRALLRVLCVEGSAAIGLETQRPWRAQRSCGAVLGDLLSRRAGSLRKFFWTPGIVLATTSGRCPVIAFA